MSKLNGIALVSVAAGTIFVYAGVKGYSIPATLQDLVTGKSPVGQSQVTGISGSSGGSVTGSPGGYVGGSNAQNKALGRMLATQAGWTGDEWTALNNIAIAESGWSDTVTNPSSGAAGIAQKIDGFGPDYQKGNARQQIDWLISYIKSRYGDPIAAWNFHKQKGWY